MPISEGAVPPAPRVGALTGYATAIGLVALATLAAFLVDSQAPIPNLSLVFVLPVVLTAVTFGWGPALTSAIAAVLAYNYFLIEPRYTLRVADPSNVWALLLLLFVAAVISAVAAKSRQRALEAIDAVSQARAMQTLARGLVEETSRTGVAHRCAAALSELFHAPAVVMLQDPEGTSELATGGGAQLVQADLDAARWSMSSGLATRGGAYPMAEATLDFWPLTTARRLQATIGVAISGRDEGRPAAPERLVEIVSGYLAVALDREAYARELLETQVQAAGEKLKTNLLAAVSHDLKTPLSTILFTLQSLQRFGSTQDADTRSELLAAAEAEATRLIHMVENLLDMNRIEAGALVANLEPMEPADLIAAAAQRAAQALEDRRLVNDASGGAPMLVDPVLFESALANVLENAGKYSPKDSTIQIRAGRDEARGWIEVLDEGDGFTGTPEPMFEKFARGVEGDGRPPGAGLGLSIARGFIEAQKGRLEARNRDDRSGARVRLVTPLAAQ